MTIETPMSASERMLLASETRIPVYRVLARRGGKKTRMTSVMMITRIRSRQSTSLPSFLT
jgi:hypothetical protein